MSVDTIERETKFIFATTTDDRKTVFDRNSNRFFTPVKWFQLSNGMSRDGFSFFFFSSNGRDNRVFDAILAFLSFDQRDVLQVDVRG